MKVLMDIHTYPNSEQAVLLVALKHDQQIRVFDADGDGALPGLGLKLQPRVPVVDQLREALQRKAPQLVEQAFDLLPFCETLSAEDGDQVALYLVEVSVSAWPANASTMPDLLRRMPKNRNRLGYLKAWQYLSGDHKLTTRAVELDSN